MNQAFLPCLGGQLPKYGTFLNLSILQLASRAWGETSEKLCLLRLAHCPSWGVGSQAQTMWLSTAHLRQTSVSCRSCRSYCD